MSTKVHDTFIPLFLYLEIEDNYEISRIEKQKKQENENTTSRGVVVIEIF